MRIANITRTLIAAAIVLALFITVRDIGRRHPERLPWTPLSLSQPIGPFTGRKLATLTDNAPLCRSLLASAGVTFTPLPPLAIGTCGYSDGVVIDAADNPRWRPAAPKIACAVAAALHVWERDIVAPAALRHFGRPVTGIDHLGSFNCRRIAGSSRWSEHATADAIDIAGFRLKGGPRISVRDDWNGTPAKAAFLRDVRDGACDLFATTLSPDYNAAHGDHFHLDQAARGMGGGGLCR